MISKIVGDTMTAAEDRSAPTVEVDGALLISQKCDATGAGIASVSFERWDIRQGKATLAGVVPSQFDKPYPGLDGAVSYGNGTVTIEHNGFYYSAFAITADEAGVPDSPAVYAASAAALTAWINA